MDGTFPDEMKIAKIIPICKSGDKNVICNYILTSLLTQFSKKLCDIKFIIENNILNVSQYGFRHI